MSRVEGGLPALLKEDWQRHHRSFSAAGFQALALHRIGQWGEEQPRLVRFAVRRIYGALSIIVRNVYGIEIPLKVQIGRRLLIGHQHGIVMHRNTVIGDDCVLRHNVTLGGGTPKQEKAAPHLGNGVVLGPGTVVLGGVSIGDGVQTGPNSLVINDVPAGAHVFATPARVMRLSPAADPDPETAVQP